MSTVSGLLDETPAPFTPSRRFSPTRVLTVLAVLIYLAEIAAMIILYFVQIPNYLLASLTDGIIMLVLILPGLYFLQLKPLEEQMQKREKADQALRENEKLLRNVLEMMPVGVWITDARGKILHGNEACHEIWGGVRYVGIDQYVEYKGWWLDSGKRIQPEEWAAARAINRGEASLNEEIEIEGFDGDRKIILNSAKPIYDEHQAIAGAVIVNQDITALKRAQQSLEEREALFRTAMENMPVGVWLTDERGKIIYGNPAGQAIWAGAQPVGPEEFGEYKGWWLGTGKRLQPEEWAVARAIDKGETSLNEEIEIECFDGTHKIILNSAIPVRDGQGKILWAFVVNQDITERKQRERALIQTNELLEKVFFSIDTLIAYLDRDFNFVRVNETYAKAGGHPVEFYFGKNHFDLFPNEENQTIFRRVVETGEPFVVLERPFEYAEFPEKGVTYWDWSLLPVKGIDGAVEGVVLSLVDITERKLGELKLAHQNQELRALSEAEHRQRELAESLVQSVIALTSSLQLEDVLNTVLDQIRRAIPFRGADVILLEGNTLRVAGFRGFEDLPGGVAAMQRSYTLDDFPLLQQIYSDFRPALIPDTLENSDWIIAPGMEWVRSYLAAPLVSEGQVIGFINLTSEKPGFFKQETVEQLMAYVAPASLALHNAQLYKDELTARQTAETLSAAALSLAQTLDLDQVLHTLMEYIDDIVATDVSGVALLDGESRLVVRVARGYPRWTGPDYVFSFPADLESEAGTLVNQVVTSRKPQLVTDTATQPLLVSDPTVEQIRSWLLVPIVSYDKTIGLVGLGKIEPRTFTQKHIQWVEALVAQAAVTIQNAWLFQQVRSSSERLQSLARKLVEIQESERYHIARELHDEAGQALSSLKLGLGRLEQDPECPAHMRQSLVGLKSVADGVLEELHRLAIDLRPIALDRLGLVAALDQYAKNLNSDRLSVQFKALGFEGGRLSRDVETSLYRIVQEALTNVIHHAQASHVGILLKRDVGKVMLFVEDDGIGFAPEQVETGDRLGLVGMLERAEMFGGSMTIESSLGEGTSIIVEVPDDNPNLDRG